MLFQTKSEITYYGQVFFCSFYIILLFPFVLHSQTILKGFVNDADTNLPLAFVNVGFIAKSVGAVSNEDGSFYLQYDASKFSNSDTLKISYLSYKEYKIPFANLQRNMNKPLEIKLEPDIINLNEVVISSRRKVSRAKKPKIVGYTVVSLRKTGSWEGSGADGGELVTKINVVNKKRQLDAFYFYVLENSSDSLLIRVNVYKGDTFYPEKKLTTKNIIYTVKVKNGKVGIDLRPYNIIVEDDFYIGIELLRNYGNKIKFVLAGDDAFGISYRRYASQGIWHRYAKDALTYSVSTTLLDEEFDEQEPVSFLKEYSDKQLLRPLNTNGNRINGFVFKDAESITNVQIRNRTTGKMVFTDEKGRYDIEAKVNDELEFSHLGMELEIRKVLETTFAINVSLKEKVIVLDNVTLAQSKKRTRSQKELFNAFTEDQGIIRTAQGFKDARQMNFSMPIVSGERLNKGVFDIISAIAGLVPSLKVKFDWYGRPEGISLRDNKNMKGSETVIYDVDGMIYEEPPFFLSVNEIDRMAVLYPGEATSMYGYRGGTGVIVINTKGASFSRFTGSQQKQSEKGTEENAITEEEARRNWPDFLKELYISSSLNDATAVYEANIGLYGSNPNFNFDASHYFIEYWPNEEFTRQLITQNLERFNSDVPYLKAMAFLMDKFSKTSEAIELYKKLIIERSNNAQSYRDLANAYVQGDFKDRGTNLYARYFNLIAQGYFSEQPEVIQEVINTEVKTLLNISEDVSHPLLDFLEKGNDDSRTRVLMEWNDDTAELSFQLISPDQSTSEWSNVMNDDSNGNNVGRGYTSKDFLIYGNSESWQVNVKYKGNKSGLATYLKVTMSTEYGSSNQKDKIEIFRMDVKNIKRELVQRFN
jgi:hypothetical protein